MAENRKSIVRQVTASLRDRAMGLARRAIRELYWSVAFDEAEDAKRFVVFHFKKDATDDVVLARVLLTGKQLNLKFAGVTRHKKPEPGEE